MSFLGLLPSPRVGKDGGCPGSRSRKDARPGDEAHALEPRDAEARRALHRQKGTRGHRPRPAPLRVSPAPSLSRSLCLCLCALLCARKARFRVAGPAGGDDGCSPHSPGDRRSGLSCPLSPHPFAAIAEAAVWGAGCARLCASTCAPSSLPCPWRVLPLLLTDGWMKRQENLSGLPRAPPGQPSGTATPPLPRTACPPPRDHLSPALRRSRTPPRSCSARPA